MKNILPTVKFELAPLEQEAELLYDFSRPGEMFIKTMERIYPDLMAELANIQIDDKENALKICRDFAKRKIAEENDRLLEFKKKVEMEWKNVEEKYLKELSQLMETSWPEDKPIITGYISILPICPRWLDNYSFSLYYNYSDNNNARITIAHEILHFLWFKKWSEVFPYVKANEYEAPNLVWRLSEIMDPIILHCQPQINELIQPVDWGYDSFKNIKIGDKGMTEYFTDIYKDCVKNNFSFDQTLKRLWEEAQKHDEEIEKF